MKTHFLDSSKAIREARRLGEQILTKEKNSLIRMHLAEDSAVQVADMIITTVADGNKETLDVLTARVAKLFNEKVLNSLDFALSRSRLDKENSTT